MPFQPVNIRVSQDPISLIVKVLEQNPRSYTKLDDLMDIARNLVSSGLNDERDERLSGESPLESIDKRKKDSERRVTFMAVCVLCARGTINADHIRRLKRHSEKTISRPLILM